MTEHQIHSGAGAHPAPQSPIRSNPPGPSPWQLATVERVTVETYRARTFTLHLANPSSFIAGQHYDVRLTAPDGYQAQRSYSIASAPAAGSNRIDLTVELIEDGEVSPYFHEVVQPGDALEVRGPIGGPFTWTARMGGPLFLVGGGSGIVPLRSILAQRQAVAPSVPALLLYSARSQQDIIYRDWLDGLADGDAGAAVRYSFTRQQPAGWPGYARRVDASMLKECIAEFGRLSEGDIARDPALPLCYVCGPTGFVESAADAFLSLGIPESLIRTERFGPTS